MYVTFGGGGNFCKRKLLRISSTEVALSIPSKGLCAVIELEQPSPEGVSELEEEEEEDEEEESGGLGPGVEKFFFNGIFSKVSQTDAVISLF